MGGRLLAGLVGSLLLHSVLVLVLLFGVAPAKGRGPLSQIVRIEIRPPPPPPPPPPEAKPPAPPELPPPKPKPRKAPTPKPPPKILPTPPPPSNDAPPPRPPKKPVPLITGISMSSTVAKGQGSGMRLGVGNTLYGTPATTVAANPNEVKAYQGAERYVAPAKVTTLPEVAREVKAPYPEAARQAELEGTVKLHLRISATGKVVSVRLIRGLGLGLDQAAIQALRRFRFKPATVEGEAVATEIDYTYTFLLD